MSDSAMEQPVTRGPGATESAEGSKKSKRGRQSSTSRGNTSASKVSSPAAKRARTLRSSKSPSVATAHKSKHHVVAAAAVSVDAPSEASGSSTAGTAHVSKHKRHRGRSAKKLVGVDRVSGEKSKKKRKKSRAASVQETPIAVTTLSSMSATGSINNPAASAQTAQAQTAQPQPLANNRRGLGYFLMEE